MRVVVARPGMLHIFISPDEQEKIRRLGTPQGDPEGAWLLHVMTTFQQEMRDETGIPHAAKVVLRDNPYEGIQ